MKLKVIFCLLFSAPVFAQESFQTLQTPTSPAAGILGIQPAAILTPKSADALEFSLFSNIANTQGGFGLPTDFALEFTPYWAKNHGLSLDEYLFPDRPLIDYLKRNSSLSVATTQNFKLEDSTASNGIGFGYRCSFFFGFEEDRTKIQEFKKDLELNQEFKSIINARCASAKRPDKFLTIGSVESILILTLEEMKSKIPENQFETLKTRIIKNVKQVIGDTLNATNYEQFSDVIATSMGDDKVFDAFKGYIRNRKGFTLDLAYASFLNFPTNNFTNSYVPKQSAWVTPGYQFKGNNSSIKIDAIGRYEWYNLLYYQQFFPTTNLHTNNFDYGVSIAAKFPRFSMQLEVVGRNSNTKTFQGTDANGISVYQNDTQSDLQYLGTFSFNISDQMLVTYTLGNRFDPVINPENTLVSTLSLNFGFGAPTN